MSDPQDKPEKIFRATEMWHGAGFDGTEFIIYQGTSLGHAKGNITRRKRSVSRAWRHSKHLPPVVFKLYESVVTWKETNSEQPPFSD